MKKTKIVQLIKEKVFSKSEELFKEYGFKYTKKQYVAEVGEKSCVIHLDDNFVLFYDENTGVLFLCFGLRFYSVITGYDKWYKENISANDLEEGYIQFNYFHFYLKLSDADYEIPTDFNPGTRAGVFTDTNVEEKLKDKNYGNGYFLPLEGIEFSVEKMRDIVSTFVKTEVDYKILLEENHDALKFKFMPLFLKMDDWAKEIYLKNYNRLLDFYKSENDEAQKEILLGFIQQQKSIGAKFLALEVDLPI